MKRLVAVLAGMVVGFGCFAVDAVDVMKGLEKFNSHEINYQQLIESDYAVEQLGAMPSSIEVKDYDSFLAHLYDNYNKCLAMTYFCSED